MQESKSTRFSVGYHLKDLLKRDVAKVYEVHNWLQENAVKSRDVSNRIVSKRMLARKIAAEICIKAAEGDLNSAKEVMDSTEGKVADIIISGNFEDLVRALEAGRQRLLTPQPAIEGEIINPHIVVNTDQQPSEEPLPAPAPTESTTSK